MFSNNGRISRRQLGCQTLLAFLGALMVIAPMVPDMRGRNGIISCILGTLGAFVYLFFLSRLSGVYRNIEKVLGKIGSKVVAVIYGLFFVISAAYIVRLLADMITKYLLTGINSWIIIGLIVVVSAWGTGWHIQRRARLAETAYTIILSGFILLLLLAAIQMPSKRPLAPESISTVGILRGSYHYFALYAAIAAAPFITARVEGAAKAGKQLMKSIGIVALIIISCLLILNVVFGSRGIAYRDLPIVDLMSGVNLPGGFLPRFDIIWMAILVFCLLFSTGSLTFYANYVFQQVQIKGMKIPLAVAVCLLAGMEYQGYNILNIYMEALCYVCVPVLLAVSLCMGFLQGRRA